MRMPDRRHLETQAVECLVIRVLIAISRSRRIDHMVKRESVVLSIRTDCSKMIQEPDKVTTYLLSRERGRLKNVIYTTGP